ncbi:MAG: hypothetical protein ACR2ND_08645, partial [Solirubrobacteraceae bacterium]
SGAWFTAAVALLAAVPVFIVLVQALTAGWAPDGDRAVVAARAYDVLSAHPPLVGAFSTTTFLTGVNTYSPGPLLYWLLAVPAHLPGLWALPTTMAVVNGASVVGSVLLARRRGGPVFMVVAAAAIVVMLSSLPTDLPSDIWAPSAPLLPFTLLVIVSWSVACGDAQLLPLAVLLASFTAQCHIAYLLPALLLLAVGVAGLLTSTRLHGWVGETVASAHRVRRSASVALLVAVVCWSFPVLDQILGSTGSPGHGNLGHLLRAIGARGQTFGFGAATHAIAHTVGLVPWWLRGYLDPEAKTFEALGAVSRLAAVSTGVFGIAVVVCVVLGWRRRRLDIVFACAVTAVLIGAVGALTVSFPQRNPFSYGYSSWWVGPAGMWAWVLLGWSVVALAPSRRRAVVPARAVLPAITATAVVAMPVLGLKTRWHAIYPQEYPALRAVMALVRARVPDRGPVLMVGRAFGFDAAIVYELRRRGLGVGIASSFADELGTSYAPAGRRFAQTLEVGDGTGLPQPAQVIGQVTMHTTPPRTATLGLKSS